MNIRDLVGLHIDEYELVNLIGQGGMSAVYRAYQDELDRHVAIKILSDDLAKDPTYIARFRQEAKMAAALEHPHIIPVYDFGMQDELTYVAMRLLHETLTDKLYAPSPMSIQAVLTMLEQTARALDYAHSRGIVHRDVKPSNIMFDELQTAYLVDFGIAKALQQADDHLTSEQTVLGTPSYMPPELWRGDAPVGASDQYALAVVAFQIFTGYLPFRADTPSSLMYKHLNEAPPIASDLNAQLPEQVATVLQKALSKAASARYPRVIDFVNALSEGVTRTLSQPASVSDQPTQGTLASHHTVPNQTVTRPNPPQADHRAKTPMPVAKQPDTVMMQVLGGGMIGIGLILTLLILALLAVFYFVKPTQNNPTDTPTTASVTAAPVIVPTHTVEIINRAEPTLDLARNEPLIAPVVDFVGMSPRTIGLDRTLITTNPIPVRDVQFSPTGTLLAAGLADGRVRLWQTATGDSDDLLGHTDVISALAFNTDGSLLATVGRDAQVLLWDTATGQQAGKLLGHSGAIRDVAFSPDGQWLATVSEDSTLRVWQVSNGQVQRTITADPTRVLTVAFSPDGQFIATGGRNGRVRLWQMADGRNSRDLVGHREEIRSLAFSPDGAYLASSSTDNRIIIWQTEDYSIAQQLDSERDVFAVTFNPDSTLLASGDRNNQIRLWDVASGEQLNTLSGHTGWVFSLSFSPDGSTLVSSSGDGSVRLWD